MSLSVHTSHESLARENAVQSKQKETARRGNPLALLLPGLLGTALYFLNNLDVLHAMIAAPAGYVPLGVQRNADIAVYLTWLNGYGKGWVLPNYSAPWSTPAEFVAPGLLPVALLERGLSLSPVLALQIFTLIGYVFVAYALAFCYKTFCQTRLQALMSLLIASACVPLAALPFLSHLFTTAAQSGDAVGRVQFMTLSDGFFRGLVTWPFLTFGTGFQVLSMSLLARYVKSSERRWLRWLVLSCLVSTLMHPFEIFVTTTTAAIVLIRFSGLGTRNLKSIGFICAAAGVGLFPYVFQTLRSAWVHEVALANKIVISPSALLGVIGLPAILIIVLLLFGWPQNQSPETAIVKTWFLLTLALFFVPGMPFALHLLDGLFIAIGLLLVVQIQDLLSRRPLLVKPLLQFVAVPLLIWSLVPHAVIRVQTWKAGIDTQNEQFPYDLCTTFHGKCVRPSALAPLGEAATLQWLRGHASPNDLVLATEDAAPWIATAPVHSFASHWLFSLLWTYPDYRVVRDAFFTGRLTISQARELLDILGVRFVVVPDGSPAKQYLDKAVQRARFATWTIYELPGAQMKPYHDSNILALGGPAS